MVIGLAVAQGACAPAAPEDDAAIASPLDGDGAYLTIEEARRDLHAQRVAHERVVDRGRDELAQLAPALTDAQVQAYAEAFAALPAARSARAAYVGSAQRLAATLEEVAGDRALLEAMVTFEPGQLVAAHVDLAKTPAAGATVRFVGRVLGARAGSPYRRLRDDAEAVVRVRYMLYDALPSAVFEALVRQHRAGASPSATAAAAIDQVSADLGGSRGAAAAVVAALQRYKTQRQVFSGSEDVTFEGVQLGEPLRQVAAILAIWNAGGSPESSSPRTGGNEVARNLRTAVQSSPTAVRAVAEGANRMRLAMGGTEQAWLRGVAQSARVVGMGMNFALAAFDTLASLSSIDSDADRARLVGNGFSLLAATLAMSPVAWAAVPLAAAAMGIKLYATHLANRELRELHREEKRACLGTFIADQEVVDALSEAHPRHLARLGTQLAMEPDAVQWLAARLHRGPAGYQSSFWPGITSTRNNDLRALTVADQVFRLTPEENEGLVRAIAGTGTADAQRAALWMVFGVLEFQGNASGWQEGITRARALEVLDERAALDVGGEALAPHARAGFQRARSYLGRVPAR